MEKKILLLTTGGTIAQELRAEGLVPAKDGAFLLSFLPHAAEQCDITVQNLMNLDSSNIQPEHWVKLAREIAARVPEFDGIVVTHGTDTLAYTASALSFLLRDLPIPVVFTGAQKPLVDPESDGRANLDLAFLMARSNRHGIFVAFHDKIIRGCRASKVHVSDPDAYASVNYPPVAQLEGNVLRFYVPPLPFYGAFTPSEKLDSRVFLLKLTPGLDPGILAALQRTGYRGFVIEAFGAGNFPFLFRDLTLVLTDIVQKGASVVVCSQCPFGASDLSLYETGRKALEAGVIPARDMTAEAAYTKLMWCLGQSDDPAAVRRLFLTNIAGEITN